MDNPAPSSAEDLVSRELDQIVATWGSEHALAEHMDGLIAEMHPVICGADTPLPHVIPAPSSFSRGLCGETSSAAECAEATPDRPATIVVYFPVLLDKALLRLVLAHELVHHWEDAATHRDESMDTGLPPSVAAFLSTHFNDQHAESIWRSAHSDRFLRKADGVANMLEIPLPRFLIGRAG